MVKNTYFVKNTIYCTLNPFIGSNLGIDIENIIIHSEPISNWFEEHERALTSFSLPDKNFTGYNADAGIHGTIKEKISAFIVVQMCRYILDKMNSRNSLMKLPSKWLYHRIVQVEWKTEQVKEDREAKSPHVISSNEISVSCCHWLAPGFGPHGYHRLGFLSIFLQSSLPRWNTRK